MKKIGRYHDNTIDADYDLYSAALSDIRGLMKKSYAKMGIKDFDQFDCESGFGTYEHHRQKNKMVSDIFFHNNFVVTQGLSGNEPWLVDGFNRLFILNAADESQTVFIKDYAKDLPVRKVVWLLYQLNYWKKARERMWNMFDRGFCLYTFLRTGINIAQGPDKSRHELDLFSLVSKYTDANTWRDYDAYTPQTYSQNGKLLFENDKFFDDIKLITRLHSIIVENKRGEKKYIPISFHAIIAQLRLAQIETGKEWTMDPDAAEKYVRTDQGVISLVKEFFDKQLSNGRSSARRAATDYVLNKYVLPVVLGKEVGKTDLEARTEKRKIVEKERRNYRRLNAVTEFKAGNTYYELESRNDELVATPYVYVKEISEKSNRTEENYFYYVFKDSEGKTKKFFKQYLEPYRGPFKFFEKKNSA